MPGDAVVHARHGRGFVVALVGRSRVRVRFDAAPSLLRTLDQRQFLDGDAPEAKPVPTRKRPPTRKRGAPRKSPAPKSPAPKSPAAARPAKLVAQQPAPKGVRPLDRPSAWQFLEALRLGVVPASGTIHYTVGRDKELQRLREFLSKRTGFLSVLGDYGAGKTHLLDAAEHLAREADFATARLAIDPSEIAIQNPARIWGALARRLEFRGEVGLEAFLRRFKESSEHMQPDGERLSSVFSPCVWALRSGHDPLATLALNHAHAEAVELERYRRLLSLTGWSGPKPISLPDYRTLGRVYVNLIGTLASWTRDVGGAGLIVILDEVERVEALTPEDQRWALQFQRHLASVTLPSRDLTFDPAQLYKGGNSTHRDVKARFETDQPLFALTAMTPLDSTYGVIDQITTNRACSLTLSDPTDRHLAQLVGRMSAIYRSAYPDFDVPSELLNSINDDLLDESAMGDSSFRRAVRRSVAKLDAARLELR